MPFNKVSVLQNVWLHDLQKSRRVQQVPPVTVVVKELPPADGMGPEVLPPAQTAAQPQPVATTQTAVPQKTPQKTKINKLETVDPNQYWGRRP